MRTTLEIDDDVLQAAKEIAERDNSTAGKVLSNLARRGLAAPSSSNDGQIFKMKNGVPVLPATGEIITMEKIQQIMDEEGI
jgi:hypothetical protein